jgi:hypothetical protein
VSSPRLPAIQSPASLGIRSKRVPLLRHDQVASTRVDGKPPTSSVATAFGPPAASWQIAVRPRGFAPPRRFAPQPSSRACCIPEPEGVRSVSSTLSPTHCPTTPKSRWRMTGKETEPRLDPADRAIPATRFTPLEEVPPPAAGIASPRPVAPAPLCLRRSHRDELDVRGADPRPRGVAPLSGVVHRATVASRAVSSPSMGFVPLQGSGQSGTADPARRRAWPGPPGPPVACRVATTCARPLRCHRPPTGFPLWMACGHPFVGLASRCLQRATRRPEVCPERSVCIRRCGPSWGL